VGESVTLKLEDLEMRLLLEGVCASAGYDFRNYLAPMLRRRVWQCVREEKLRTISGFQEKALHDPDCMGRFIQALSINVSALYRDPEYYLALKQEVLPRLGTYPFIRIWHAGCAAGEEVFSTAILLHEAGLYERSRIYATDISVPCLDQARSGTIPLAALRESSARYLEAGGSKSLADYYATTSQGALLDPALRKHIVFAEHNLVTDSSFNEFNLICCRNVLIYFNKSLQDRVHELFAQSLSMFGFLALGSKESLRFTCCECAYEEINHTQKLYRKIR
jgi:chemotaxis protein methyltransferase CheR